MDVLERLRNSQIVKLKVRDQEFLVRHMTAGEQEEARSLGEDAYVFTIARSLLNDDRSEVFPREPGEAAHEYVARIKPTLSEFPYSLLMELYVAISEETVLKLVQRTEAIQKKYGIIPSPGKP